MAVTTQLASSFYTGLTATRCRYSEKIIAGNAQIRSRIQHYARAQMLGTILRYDNMYGPSETGSGGILTLKASIEYPIGTFNRITFNGGATSVAIADASSALSDALTFNIPDGAMFREWTYAVFAGGQVLCAQTSQNVDTGSYGATVTDPTAAGASMAAAQVVYGATAFIGKTDKPSILILGDSRQSGLGSYTAYGSNDTGNVPRPVGGSYAYISMASSGAPMWQFHFNSTAKLKGLAAYCTHIVIGGGYNDLNGGDTAAALKGSIESVITDFNPNGNKPTFVCTIEPSTTSSDSWATEANQTIWDGTKNGHRNTYNGYVRSGSIVGAWGMFDLAKNVESVANPGKWLAPGYTADGIHGTLMAEIAQMLAVNPSYFGSKAYA